MGSRHLDGNLPFKGRTIRSRAVFHVPTDSLSQVYLPTWAGGQSALQDRNFPGSACRQGRLRADFERQGGGSGQGSRERDGDAVTCLLPGQRCVETQ